MFILQATTLFFILALTACSHLDVTAQVKRTAQGQSFSDYAENVFRLENSLTSEAMMLSEFHEMDHHSAILQAEQRMHQACQSLNEYATQKTEGSDIGLWLPLRVRQSAFACEKAAKHLKASLADH